MVLYQIASLLNITQRYSCFPPKSLNKPTGLFIKIQHNVRLFHWDLPSEWIHLESFPHHHSSFSKTSSTSLHNLFEILYSLQNSIYRSQVFYEVIPAFTRSWVYFRVLKNKSFCASKIYVGLSDLLMWRCKAKYVNSVSRQSSEPVDKHRVGGREGLEELFVAMLVQLLEHEAEHLGRKCWDRRHQ